MEKLTVFCLLTVLLSAVLNVSLALIKTEYFKEGGDLTLRPEFEDRIVSILWKLNGDMVAEWIENIVPLEYYGRFKDRTDLDIKTGKLVMKNLTKEDEGLFTLELNSKVLPQHFISKAIKEVPKPKVWMQPVVCSPDKHSQCALSCEGDTTDAGPVTYSWKEGDGQWQWKEKIINITKTASAQVKTYTCQMENPVSVQQSEGRDNPFFKSEPPVHHQVLVIIKILVVIALLVIFLVFLSWIKQKTLRKLMCSCTAENTFDSSI
ncbi:CD48 antigen-like [Cheilinus undulatus]|uniref:CD48 antigen-like n=1 Tax=Cheilinus undulatus TaxID=241271 RepID=UPI001BD21B4B|nr:CD48 antigen-like [Cheilinus undulatus]